VLAANARLSPPRNLTFGSGIAFGFAGVLSRSSRFDVLTPENLAATFRIRARVESCSQGKPHLIVDDAI